jgi:hypothetical protein
LSGKSGGRLSVTFLRQIHLNGRRHRQAQIRPGDKDVIETERPAGCQIDHMRCRRDDTVHAPPRTAKENGNDVARRPIQFEILREACAGLGTFRESGDDFARGIAELPVHAGEIGRCAVELRIAGIDRPHLISHFIGQQDRLLADEGIGAVA